LPADGAAAGSAETAAGHHPADSHDHDEEYERPRWHRVVLKLSGEAFAGRAGLGIDPDSVSHFAREIKDASRLGIQVAVVVGGGNMFRGAALSARGIDRARADYMGMLGTVINCLALQDVLEKLGIETRVQTAITMGRWPSPTYRGGLSGTWRRVGSSFSAPGSARHSSRPTPAPRSGRWRSARRRC
jgi:uridylate kinase